MPAAASEAHVHGEADDDGIPPAPSIAPPVPPTLPVAPRAVGKPDSNPLLDCLMKINLTEHVPLEPTFDKEWNIEYLTPQDWNLPGAEDGAFVTMITSAAKLVKAFAFYLRLHFLKLHQRIFCQGEHITDALMLRIRRRVLQGPTGLNASVSLELLQ